MRRRLTLKRALLRAAPAVGPALLMLAMTACGPTEGPSEQTASSPHGSVRQAAREAAAGQEPASHGAGSRQGTGHDAMAHRDLAPAAPSDFPIYHLESTWTDQADRERQLRSFEGRPVLIAMLYTSCAFACPRIMLDLKRIEGELGDAANETRFVVVSIDPERDTPARLAEFAAGSRLDPNRWTLLTAEEGDILELAAVLGVQYRETSPGEWVHSNLITVLDPDGEVAHRQLGLGTDPSETLSVIRSFD
jgi:protein SCO1/2